MTATKTNTPVRFASRMFVRGDDRAVLSYRDRGHAHEVRLEQPGDFPAVYRLSTRAAARKVWRALRDKLTGEQGYAEW